MVIPSDDRETARVIGIHDGARDVGYTEAIQDVARLIKRLCTHIPERVDPYNRYAEALDDVLQGMQGLQAEKRKT